MEKETMTWEEKVEMVKRFNNEDDSVFEYVSERVAKFDDQAADMFMTAVNFSEILEKPSLMECIKPILKTIRENHYSNLSLKVLMKLEIFEEMVKEILEESKDMESLKE